MTSIDISVVIPTRNRNEILWGTMEKAVSACENTNAEIIVVNDGDAPLNIPAQFNDKIRYFENPGKGVSAARNYAVQVASGAVLFFIDDDMWISRESLNWITQHVVNNPDKEAVYNMNWVYPPSLNDKLSGNKIGQFLLAGKYNTMWGRMQEKGESPAAGLYKFNAIGSGSLIMHKKVFEKIGGYNDKMVFQGEDIDLANRINGLSIPIYCVFDVTLFHNHQDRFEIKGFLDRLSSGFESQFNAVRSGLLKAPEGTDYSGRKKVFLDLMLNTEQAWIWLLRLSPNNSLFVPLNNKLIGALGAMQQYRQWKKLIKPKKRDS